MFKSDLLPLSLPLLNAAGSLGFMPDRRGPVDLGELGAFITNPISLQPRSPAQGTRLLDFPGGFLLHTGYPNPGFKKVLQHFGGYWARSPLPVLVHLLAEDPGEISEMVRRLEAVEGVIGVEIGIPPLASASLAAAMLQAAQGELPVVLRLPLERAAELAQAFAGSGPFAESYQRSGFGLTAFSLAPPRGMLPDQDGRLVQGRLYGPAIFPVAMAAVRFLVELGLPVFGAGGLYGQPQVAAMLAAGAVAVQLDSFLWRSAGNMGIPTVPLGDSQ